MLLFQLLNEECFVVVKYFIANTAFNALLLCLQSIMIIRQSYTMKLPCPLMIQYGLPRPVQLPRPQQVCTNCTVTSFFVATALVTKKVVIMSHCHYTEVRMQWLIPHDITCATSMSFVNMTIPFMTFKCLLLHVCDLV